MKKRTHTFLLSLAFLTIGILLPIKWWNHFLSLSEMYLTKIIIVTIANVIFLYTVSNNEKGRNPLSNNNGLLLIIRFLISVEWLVFIACGFCVHFFANKVTIVFVYGLAIKLYITFLLMSLFCALDTSDTKHY